MTKAKVFNIYVALCVIMVFGASSAHPSDALRALIGAIDAGTAVALAFLAAFAYWSAKRDDDWITVTICYPDGHQEQINDAFQREQCSRSEVTGVLGAFHGKGQHDISYLKDPVEAKRFREDMKRVREGHSSELRVPIRDSDTLRGIEHHRPRPLTDARPLAFWNISNHPSAGWTEAQRAAALAIAPGAEVIDVPFPDVDPNLDTSALKAAAAAVVRGWGAPSAGERRVVAAMVAGEPLMCVELVGALEARGVRCYSATTLRVAEEVDGEKRSRFEFVRFRAWRA